MSHNYIGAMAAVVIFDDEPIQALAPSTVPYVLTIPTLALSADPFSSTSSAHADGERRGAGSESEGGIGKVSARRVLRYPQIDAGPRCPPSACSEITLSLTVPMLGLTGSRGRMLLALLESAREAAIELPWMVHGVGDGFRPRVWPV